MKYPVYFPLEAEVSWGIDTSRGKGVETILHVSPSELFTPLPYLKHIPDVAVWTVLSDLTRSLELLISLAHPPPPFQFLAFTPSSIALIALRRIVPKYTYSSYYSHYTCNVSIFWTGYFYLIGIYILYWIDFEDAKNVKFWRKKKCSKENAPKNLHLSWSPASCTLELQFMRKIFES